MNGSDGSVSCSLSIPDLACAVCGLRIQVHFRAAFSFTHAHGGCDEWRSETTRARCIGRVELMDGLRLRFWPKGETEYSGALGYGGNS
jgi:hypothetical protein